MGRSVIDLDGACSSFYVEEFDNEITSVRVYRLEDEPFGQPPSLDDADYDDAPWPWQVDGIDVRVDPPRVTEEVWNFTSFKRAIASVADFASHYTVVSTTSDPPCSHEIRGSSGDCAACGRILRDW